MEKVINVITLGDSGVGKTSIINRIKDGTFKNDYSVTINIDHFFIRKKYKKKFDNKIGISRNSKSRSI